MTKSVFRELVFLEVNGGQLNDSASANRRLINAYLPCAINWVMINDYRINLRQEPTRDIASLFYGYFPDLPVLVDAARHNWKYVAYPKKIVPMPRNQGIRGIEDGTGYQLKPLSDNGFRTIGHFGKIFDDRYYRPEQKGIYLFNLPSPVTAVSGVFIVDVNDLLDTDELPIPAGQETEAIKICIEFATGVRQTPADRKTDQRDTN